MVSNELIGVFSILIGAIFIAIASIGILRLPDFYVRMSAITKAGTMGVGFIALGIAIHYGDLIISIKAFVIITFMLFTAPVAAHIIARAAYKHGIPFWGKNLVDELNELVVRRNELEKIVHSEPENIFARQQLIDCYTSLPPIQGGSFKKAVIIASEIKDIDAAEGHLAMGLIYMRDQDPDLAMEEYKMAVETSGGKEKYKAALDAFFREAEEMVGT